LNKDLVNRLADLLAASPVAFDRYLSANVGAGSARNRVMSISPVFYEPDRLVVVLDGAVVLALAVVGIAAVVCPAPVRRSREGVDGRLLISLFFKNASGARVPCNPVKPSARR
jgi:hypothetical protein